ncbi:MAG TPA: four helix bundle protein [Thermoanaerobaculia bacterium]|nr:four helix bundle protein [Thermoanaerobaculia bacterium]
MESGKGAELRERVFEFGVAVLGMHRFYYRREPSLRGATQQASAAATSIGANLEEADAGQSRADFTSKCNIALKEARETRYWLRIVARFAPSSRMDELVAESTELIAILTAIVRKSRNK